MYKQETPLPPGVGAASPRKLLPEAVGRLTLALHASVVAVALSLAFVLFDNSLFAWHPVFMAIGFLIFMSEGVLSAIMFRHIEGTERVKAIQSHALLQLRAVLCIAIGFGVIYRNKVLLGKPHFASTHAKLGLATLALSCCMPLWGLVAFRKMGIIQRFPERWQPAIKMLHRQLGLVTWLAALVTIEFALPHKAVYKGGLTRFWQAGVALVGVLMLTLSGKAKAMAKLKAEQDIDPASKSV